MRLKEDECIFLMLQIFNRWRCMLYDLNIKFGYFWDTLWTGAVDPQDLKDRKPKIEEVLVTPRRHFNVYSLIIKQNHFQGINEEYIKVAIHNLRIALERENISEFRISKYGDISDALPKRKVRELLTQEFVNSKIEITICYGNANIPPEEIRTQIISENHESKIGGHKAINETYRRIRERYMWPGHKDQVTEFVRKCDTCQKQKIVRAKIHELMLIIDKPLDTIDKVSLDTVGKLPTTPDGNKHILTMQDNLSKYCIAVPIPDMSATTVAHVIAKHLFSQYGAPRAILTDRGGSFINDLLRKLSKNFGVKQITTSGYRPRSNKSLERSHAVLLNYKRAYAEQGLRDFYLSPGKRRHLDQQISERRQGSKDSMRSYAMLLLTLTRRRGGFNHERIMEALYHNMKPGL